MLATTLTAALAVLAPLPQSTSELNGAVPYAQVSTATPQPRVLSTMDAATFRQGLSSARARNVIATQDAIARISDPTARKLLEWALIDTSGAQMTYDQLARDQLALAGWPRADSRRSAGEAALDRARPAPEAALAFFNGSVPTTAQGAIALAAALEQSGRTAEAQALIGDWWRTRSFEAQEQSRILERWSGWLTQADHDARMDVLLLGPHGPATRAMLNLVSPQKAAVANTVMGLRSAYSPDAMVSSLSPAQATEPAVALERVRILRAAGRGREGFPLLRYLPAAPSHREGQNTLWTERRNYYLDAVQAGEWQAAYDAMNGHGFPSGDRKVDAEFFAGFIALTKLNDPTRAARHFETLRTVSSTPITQGRALYWLGRAFEAQGDRAAAQQAFQGGAQHIQTFYGQLAAEKAGYASITLPAEPRPTAADAAAFEANEVVRALRILGETDEMSLLRVFAYELDDTLPDAASLALLMDTVRGYGDGFGAMMVGRAASQRGFLLPERQYPIRIPPQVAGAAPLAFTLAITRQESSFDPRARSGADARGMMQFLPATASGVARRLGMGYSPERLWDPDYNMTLGSYHLGELMGNFGNSMLMTTVGYNAGPARAPQWVARCGDPRGDVDAAINYIECAPFTETRNYMMRVMENMSIYKARLNGGTAPLTLSTDISQGTRPGPTAYTPY